MLNAILDVILPSVCPSCGSGAGSTLCASCRADLPWIDHPCSRCGSPRLQADTVCRSCHDLGWPAVGLVTVHLAYHGQVTELIARAKARNDRAAALALVNLIPIPQVPVDAVIPIPPNPGRRAGPHLPQLLARRAAKHLNRPILRALTIQRSAQRQHRLGLHDRERNVEHLYAAHGQLPKSVLIVDDLLTTGSTLRAAAKALRQAGARTVHAWAAARTPRHDDDNAASSPPNSD